MMNSQILVRQGMIASLVWILLMLGNVCYATGADTPASKTAGVIVKDENGLSDKKLNDIVDSIQQQRKLIEKKLVVLRQAKTVQQKTKIQAEINKINRAIEDQEASFELILTAGQTLISEEQAEEQAFDWQQDLLEIVQPILSELKEMTENKRKLDDLNEKIALYQAKTQEIEEVMRHLSKFDEAALRPDTLIQFKRIEEKWRVGLQESQHLLEVAQLQQDGVLKSEEAKALSFAEHIQLFFWGRGATLMMAIATFVIVFLALLSMWKAIVLFGFQKNAHWTYYQRLISLVYHSLTVMLAIAAVFYVLSVRNDQVLIAIGILLLISVIWVLKNSIPRYVDELKLLLNTGAVREGECINYRGISMKIDQLNFYTILTNPALPDLKLRLPVSALLDYVSRPYIENEPWFPCKKGDYVMLSDDSYGQVQCITLEYVQLSLSDGSMLQTYSVSDFLSANPTNLSRGFLITSLIGVDYQYQSQCTTTIPAAFEAGIRSRLLEETYGSALKSISVNFNQANTSSLDFKIIVVFEGSAADTYFSIQRDLQRFAVDVCNQHKWEIPFNQLVVHQS